MYPDRNEAIAFIRQSLRERSGLDWSVRGDRGTAWGWIQISAPPRRRVGFDGQTPNPDGGLSLADQEILSQLLDCKVYHDGVSIPAGDDFYQEYVDRAAGRPPTVYGAKYWD